MLLIRGSCRSGAKYAFVKVNVICTKTQGLRITYTPNSLNKSEGSSVFVQYCWVPSATKWERYYS